MLFRMTAECNPKNSDAWFDGYQHGGEFAAETFDKALEWLDAQCNAAGTDADPYFLDFGPTAEALEYLRPAIFYGPQQCEMAAAFERKRLQRAYGGVIFTRAICEIEPVGE